MKRLTSSFPCRNSTGQCNAKDRVGQAVIRSSSSQIRVFVQDARFIKQFGSSLDRTETYNNQSESNVRHCTLSSLKKRGNNEVWKLLV